MLNQGCSLRHPGLTYGIEGGSSLEPWRAELVEVLMVGFRGILSEELRMISYDVHHCCMVEANIDPR